MVWASLTTTGGVKIDDTFLESFEAFVREPLPRLRSSSGDSQACRDDSPRPQLAIYAII